MTGPDMPREAETPLAAPFWRGAGAGQILVQQCSRCGYRRWPPGPICTECQQPGGLWAPVRPSGTLYSYAEYFRAFDPALVDEIPYTVGLVELDDGPRMFGRLVGSFRTEDVGRRMRAIFEPNSARATMICWELDPSDTGAMGGDQ